MRFILFLLLGVLFITLQTTLFQALPAWVGVPDLLFLLIVFVAIHFSTAKGAVLTLIFGIVMEVFSGYFLGIYVIAYLLIFFMIKALSIGLAIDEANHQPPIVALSYLLANGIIYACTAMLAEDSLVPWSWGAIMQRLLIITILVVPMDMFFERLWKLKSNRGDDDQTFMQLFQPRKGNRYRTNR